MSLAIATVVANWHNVLQAINMASGIVTTSSELFTAYFHIHVNPLSSENSPSTTDGG